MWPPWPPPPYRAVGLFLLPPARRNTVLWPGIGEAAGFTGAHSAVSHESGGSSERSLFLVVAEDRPTALRNLPERLDPARYEVDVRPFGEEALRAVRERAPAAVLLDAEHLYAEGRAPVELVRAACPKTRVLFLDEDGGWLLFIEPSGEETMDLLVHPCAAEEFPATLEQILNASSPT